MFPNNVSRLMRMMDGNSIPAENTAGTKMDFVQRVEWLIEYANQQMRANDVACWWCEQAANPNNHSVTVCPFHKTPRA